MLTRLSADPNYQTKFGIHRLISPLKITISKDESDHTINKIIEMIRKNLEV